MCALCLMHKHTPTRVNVTARVYSAHKQPKRPRCITLPCRDMLCHAANATPYGSHRKHVATTRMDATPSRMALRTWARGWASLARSRRCPGTTAALSPPAASARSGRRKPAAAAQQRHPSGYRAVSIPLGMHALAAEVPHINARPAGKQDRTTDQLTCKVMQSKMP